MKKNLAWIMFAFSLISKNTLFAFGKDYTQLVNPFIGTGAHGHTYPGATSPFGMVQLSPDTRTNNWDAASGYHFSDNTFMGFSHKHLSGTGIGDWGDILFTPHFKYQFKEIDLSRKARYPLDHKQEKAYAGYYELHLPGENVNFALTTSTYTGFHRYSFNKSLKDQPFILEIDLNHSLSSEEIQDLKLATRSSHELSGHRYSSGWGKNQKVYFHIYFDHEISEIGFQSGSKGNINKSSDHRGKYLKAFVKFKKSKSKTLNMKVTLSPTSEESAFENHKTFASNKSFDEALKINKKQWNNTLSKIDIKGGSIDHQKIFYTALYHNSVAPNMFSNADRSFRGHDQKMYTGDDPIYTVYSLWDTFRATHPLHTILETKRTLQFIRHFLKIYEQTGRLPIWELSGSETHTMIGIHSISVIVDAYMKGLRDFDVDLAYKAIKENLDLDYRGLKAFNKKGYMDANDGAESVSKTLEYAYNNFCAFLLAHTLNKQKDALVFYQRSMNYANLFDWNSNFMRPKRNGGFFEPFDPRAVTAHFTEANSYQYSYFATQDIPGLIGLYGGENSFINKLDDLFTTTTNTTGRDQPDITGMIGQYAHGNEPSHHMAYLYTYTRDFYKTAYWVKKIKEEMYHNGPEGIAGNDDVGQMSAWYVFSALGFYPINPGETHYVFGTPSFDKATLNLENGAKFEVIAHNLSEKNYYLQKVKINGELWHKNYIEHEDIMRGGKLEFFMGAQPTTFSFRAKPTLSPKGVKRPLAMPLIQATTNTFKKELVVELKSKDDRPIYYSIDGTRPSIRKGKKYEAPIKISQTAKLQAIAIDSKGESSQVAWAQFFKLNHDYKVTYNGLPSPLYPGQGPLTLVDGQKGGDELTHAAYQGFHGINFDVFIDLGGLKKIKSVTPRFLEDLGSWIFYPQTIEIWASMDGMKYKLMAIKHIPEAQEMRRKKMTNFSFNLNGRPMRALQIRARNIKTCPQWHPGRGSKAWIFTDEVLITEE